MILYSSITHYVDQVGLVLTEIYQSCAPPLLANLKFFYLRKT